MACQKYTHGRLQELIYMAGSKIAIIFKKQNYLALDKGPERGIRRAARHLVKNTDRVS